MDRRELLGAIGLGALGIANLAGREARADARSPGKAM